MSRRANATLIGLFIVGAIILAISAILLFSSGVLRDKSRFIMFFDGSVKGLNVGAPVNFRGVKIGTVTDIRLLLDPDTQRVYIPVYVELDPGSISLITGEKMTTHKMKQMSDMIEHGLRAQLQMQSLLTGQLAVQLDIYPNTPANLVGTNENIIEIPTIRTPIQEFTRKLEEFPIDVLLENLASAAEGINKLVNGPELSHAIKQFDQTMLEYNTLAQRLDQRSDTLSTDLNITLKELRATLQMTHGLISSGETLMNDSNELVQQLRASSQQLTISTQETLDSIKATSNSANQLVDDDSPFQHQLTRTLEEVARSARAVRVLADTLEQNPEALITGKPDEGEK